MLLGLLAMMLAAAAAHAQTRVDSLQFQYAGILERTSEKKIIKDGNISVGQRTEFATRLVKSTNVVPLRSGTVFGTQFRVSGYPQGASVALRIVWSYPSPGIFDRRTGTGRLRDE